MGTVLNFSPILMKVHTVTVGQYQNAGDGTGTDDIKVLSQVGHSLPPAEFNAHFDDSEDMLLGRGIFDGISVVSFRYRYNKEVCNYMPFVPYVRKPVFSWWDKFGTLISKFEEKWWDIDIKNITMSHCDQTKCIPNEN